MTFTHRPYHDEFTTTFTVDSVTSDDRYGRGVGLVEIIRANVRVNPAVTEDGEEYPATINVSFSGYDLKVDGTRDKRSSGRSPAYNEALAEEIKALVAGMPAAAAILAAERTVIDR